MPSKKNRNRGTRILAPAGTFSQRCKGRNPKGWNSGEWGNPCPQGRTPRERNLGEWGFLGNKKADQLTLASLFTGRTLKAK